MVGAARWRPGDLASFDWQLRINENGLDIADRIDIPVDPRIIETLGNRVPEFRRAYDADGMTIDEFESFGATRRTLRQFLEADAALDDLVRDILVPTP